MAYDSSSFQGWFQHLSVCCSTVADTTASTSTTSGETNTSPPPKRRSRSMPKAPQEVWVYVRRRPFQSLSSSMPEHNTTHFLVRTASY